ncbi:MAG: Fur family transcriptional regulator [Thermoanaerobaculia bacterium]
MRVDVEKALTDHGVQPSAQRLAVARYVLSTHEHPTADRVFSVVRESFPWISRATVYNTLNLFVEKGLLRAPALTGGSVVFDPNTERHHHFIDEMSGAIHDVPWESVDVCNIEALEGFDVTDFQVVMRGVKRRRRRT